MTTTNRVSSGRRALSCACNAALSFSALCLSLDVHSAAPDPDGGDALQFHVDERLSYDDNLFRLPAAVAPATNDGNTERASQIRIDSVGFSWDKQYSLQRIHADARMEHHQYSNHGFLNFNSVNGSLAWNWSLTPHLTGVLSADRNQVLNSFSDFRNQASRNLRTNESRVASADYEIEGSWHVLVALLDYASVSDNKLLPVEDTFRSHGAQAGVKYILPSGSYLSYLERSERGEYPGQGGQSQALIDTEFTQRTHEILALWNFSEKTLFNARISNSERTHPNFSQRDFSGTAGRLDVTWKPTAKIGMVLSLGRDLTSYQTGYSNYIDSNALSITPTWIVSDKTQLKGRFSRSTRDYRGEPFGSVTMRKDTINSAQLEFDWQAMRNIALAAMLQHDKRDSNYPGFGFTDTTATLSIRIAF